MMNSRFVPQVMWMLQTSWVHFEILASTFPSSRQRESLKGNTRIKYQTFLRVALINSHVFYGWFFKRFSFCLHCLLFLCSMDKNGTMTVDWNEWKQSPSQQPAENIPEIILYWKHSTVSISLTSKNCTGVVIHASFIPHLRWLDCLLS